MNNYTEIKKIIEGILINGGFVYEDVEIVEKNHMGPVFVIKSTDSGMLIGPQGETLRSLNFLLKRMVSSTLKLDRKSVV